MTCTSLFHDNTIYVQFHKPPAYPPTPIMYILNLYPEIPSIIHMVRGHDTAGELILAFIPISDKDESREAWNPILSPTLHITQVSGDTQSICERPSNKVSCRFLMMDDSRSLNSTLTFCI